MTSTNTIMVSIRRRRLDHILKGIKRYELLKVAEMACLTLDEVRGYKGDHELYGWRVAPRSPVDYRALGIERHITDYGLERPPQGWCYV